MVNETKNTGIKTDWDEGKNFFFYAVLFWHQVTLTVDMWSVCGENGIPAIICGVICNKGHYLIGTESLLHWVKT